MPKLTLALKSSVTRRQTAEPVDQLERQRQAEHHEAAENAATTGQEVPTAIEPEQSSKDLKRDAHALQSAFLAGNLGKPVAVFTINGIKLTSKLMQFDQFTLLVQGQDGIESLIFKHAITTVTRANDVPGKQRQLR